jgi:hypothetical protein
VLAARKILEKGLGIGLLFRTLLVAATNEKISGQLASGLHRNTKYNRLCCLVPWGGIWRWQSGVGAIGHEGGAKVYRSILFLQL